MKNKRTSKPSMALVQRIRSSGFITTNVVLFTGVTTLAVVGAVASASLSQITMASRAQDKAAALALADAGVDDVVDRLRDTSSPNWPGANATWAGAKTKLLVDPTNPSSESAGEFQVLSLTKIDNRHFKARTTGVLPNASQRGVVALIDFQLRSLGDAAIKSNGDIKIGGNGNIVVDSGPLKNANAQANGNITMNSGSSLVEGSLLASGTISGSPGPNQVVSVVAGVPKMTFPTPIMLLDFEAEARAASQTTAPQYSFPNKLSGPLTLTGPRYIKGDINLGNGDTLNLVGGGDVTVYVEGGITMSNGSTFNNGVTLVVHGTLKQTGGSYQVTPPPAVPASTMGTTVAPVVNSDPSLIVFNNDSPGGDAISMNGNGSNSNIGPIYAAFGDIKLNGGATYIGSFAAASLNASVTLNGNFTLRYPVRNNTGAKLPSDPTVTFWGETQ